MTVKVRVGQTKNVRLVASGEKRPVIVPDSITLGIDTVGEYVGKIDAGAGIVVAPENNIETANLVISHAITSTQANTTNSVLELFNNATLDQFGHITSLVSIGLDANNFISNNDIISSKSIAFGNTAITLGETTDEFRGLNLIEVGDFTITDSTITTDANVVSFSTSAPLGTFDFGTRRITGVDNPVDSTDVVNKRHLETEIERIENTVKIVADPILDTDATNKRYVDNLVKGLVVRPAALAATTADLGGFFESGNSTFGSTITLNPVSFLYIDDVTSWDLGSNLVVKDQTNPLENGSYDLIQVGSANTEWVFQRTEWSNQSYELPGSYEFVTDGTINGGTGWVITVPDASTFNLNVDPINWTQFQGEGTFTAGRGLTLNGTQFVVDKIQDIEQISGNGAIILPVGDSASRPTPASGMIRFNDVDGQFEGYDGVAWSGLGGTIDLDQDTKISAENVAGDDNDELKFFTGGTLAAKFDSNTANFYGDVVIAGNITVGDANTDSITVAADFESNLIPNADRTYSLGAVGKNWSTIFVDTIASDDGIITFAGTGAIAVPSANTSLRPSGPAGMLRFNSDENRFEGWDGVQWSGLAGSVIDLDRNTYIIAESSAGADNNELDFYTAGIQRAQIDSSGSFRYGSGLDKIVIDYNTSNLFVNSKITANNNLILDPVGYIDVANNTLTGLARPVNPSDAVNLEYLDGEFSSGLTIVDGANTYVDGINLLNSPTIKIGEGLELEELDSANNTFQIGLDKPGDITPGIYGNDRYMPRFRLTEDGRIDFATEIPVELQANAIPNFTETTRDIVGLMIADGIANNENEGVTLVYDDEYNQLYTQVNDPFITLGGNLSGTSQIINLSNTTIDATITADYLRTVEPSDANSGIIVTHALGANTTAQLDLDYSYLDTVYVPSTGGTYTGDIFAPRFVDSDNTSFFVDPAGRSEINKLDIGVGTTFSELRFRDGPGSFTTLYGGQGKVGFLDGTFAFTAYFEKSTTNWIVPKGDVHAERFVDADATNYFLHPGGDDSFIKKLSVQNEISASGITIGGLLTPRKINASGNLEIEAYDGVSINGSGNDLDVNSSKITNVLDPTAGQDAATKSYVDSVAQGLRIIPAALAATTIDLAATYNPVDGTLTDASANTAAFVLDGVTSWSIGDKVLVKDQTNASENGSYELTAIGDISNPWVLTRGEYFNQSSEIPGSFQFIIDGTQNAGTGWVANVNDAETFVLDTDTITWYQFSGAGTYTAGEALTLTGTEFSITDGDIQNVKLANPQINISGEAGANTSIALGETLTINGTNGVNTTISANQIDIAVDELDGGSF